MKNWKLWTVAVLGGLVLAGCGEAKPPPADDAQVPQTGGFLPTLTEDRGITLAENQYEVRLLGTGFHQYQGVYVNVDSMTATAGGVPIPVQMKATVMDLAVATHAPLVGYITLPAGVDSAQVVLRLDAFGAVEDARGARPLDVRSPAIRFEVTRSLLAPRKHAVVQVDLSRSIVSQRVGDTMMLPATAVAF